MPEMNSHKNDEWTRMQENELEMIGTTEEKVKNKEWKYSSRNLERLNDCLKRTSLKRLEDTRYEGSLYAKKVA
jgi:hypothetical protein